MTYNAYGLNAHTDFTYLLFSKDLLYDELPSGIGPADNLLLFYRDD